MKLVYDFSVTSLRRPASVAPALSLDFVAGVYSRSGVAVPLSSALSFSRASSAMRINAAGLVETVSANTLRFDHVFGTGTPRGALFEPAATNVLSYSRDFSQAYWTGYAAKPTFAGGQTAPDGSTTAMRWNCADTVGGTSGARGGILVVNGTPTGTATTTVWLKASAPLVMQFGQSDGTSQQITLTTSWQRFTYTNTLPNAQNRIFMLYEDVNTATYVYIWGAQTEIGAQASANIYTSGAAATRAADVAGLLGVSGTHDVTLTYDDDSTQLLAAQSLSDGWWPSLTRRRVKKLVVA